MAFDPVTMYRVLCDGCGTCAQEDSDYYAWADEEQAWIEADCSEWREIDSNHYCPDCYVVDDDDRIKPVEKSPTVTNPKEPT